MRSLAGAARSALPSFDLVAQPIRPLVRQGARFSRLPWAEVLLRPTSGESPESFVRQASDAGYASDLDYAVLSMALPRMRTHVHHSINLSVATLCESSAATKILGAIGEAGVRCDRIVIEVVSRDGATWEQLTATARTLNTLRLYGVATALDDLAADEPAGLVSLSGVVDYVKFDCSVTARLLEDGALPPAVQRHLRLFTASETVAEGVETSEQFMALRKVFGITYWQGYYDDGAPTPLPSAKRLPQPGVTVALSTP